MDMMCQNQSYWEYRARRRWKFPNLGAYRRGRLAKMHKWQSSPLKERQATGICRSVSRCIRLTVSVYLSGNLPIYLIYLSISHALSLPFVCLSGCAVCLSLSLSLPISACLYHQKNPPDHLSDISTLKRDSELNCADGFRQVWLVWRSRLHFSVSKVL